MVGVLKENDIQNEAEPQVIEKINLYVYVSSYN